MARTKGLLPISANFEPKTAEPFDARMRIPTKAELILPATWQSSDGNVYTYPGMIVTVWNDGANNGIYRLNAADYTVASNWELAGGNVSGAATNEIPKVDSTGKLVSSGIQAENVALKSQLTKEQIFSIVGHTVIPTAFVVAENITGIPYKTNINTLILRKLSDNSTQNLITTGGVLVTLPVAVAAGAYQYEITYTDSSLAGLLVIQSSIQ